jgi:hypothetical protein
MGRLKIYLRWHGGCETADLGVTMIVKQTYMSVESSTLLIKKGTIT